MLNSCVEVGPASHAVDKPSVGSHMHGALGLHHALCQLL